MPGERDNNRDLLRSIKLVAVLGTILLLLSVGIALVYVRSVEKEAATNDRVGICRGNLVRGYLLLRAREVTTTDDSHVESETSKFAPLLFHVLDCETAEPLVDAEQARYLALLNQGLFPQIEDGRVVGADPLP